MAQRQHPFWQRARHSVAGLLGVSLRHAQTLYAEEVDDTVRPGDRWLDIGCGRQVIPDWAMPAERQRDLVSRCSCLVGIDTDVALAENPQLTHRVWGLGGTLPFRAGFFDVVTANVVVEHVPDPNGFLSDICGVLRPGGQFVFHTPNYLHPMMFLAALVPQGLKVRLVYLLEGRQEEDVFPTHYKLNTESEIRRKAAETGFDVESIRLVGPTGFFARLGPLGVLELFILRLYAARVMRPLRSNLIVRLKKRD